MTSPDTLHTVIAVASLVAIGYGLHSIYAPLCPLLIGTLLLVAVINARRQPIDKKHNSTEQE